jgi:hypothetical protein
MGPGALKFSFVGAPTVADPDHTALSTGPFQLGVSCRPGKNPGDIGFTLFVTIPATIEYTQTLESVPTTEPPLVNEGIEPAHPFAEVATNVESGKSPETWGTLMVTNMATGTSTWLELWYGAVTGGISPHCFLRGIEI